jgi:flagellar hook-length control protein FliK
VQITEDASGAMSIAIHATSSEAHDLLQQYLPGLRARLEQREVRVEQLQVDQQTPSAGPGWTDGGGREPNRRRDSSEDGQPQWSPLASLRHSSRVGAEAAQPRATVAATRSSAVDVRA